MKLIDLIEERELRVHGNGFMQLDVDDRRRLHFWGHYAIPRQQHRTTIHDHIFSFESTVLKGQLVNVTLVTLQYGIDYKVHRVEDALLVDSGDYCSLRVSKTETVWAGDGYRCNAGEIHDTLVVCPTITLLHKLDMVFTGISNGARVFVPWGTYPDNDFDRYGFEQPKLKEIAREIVGDADAIALPCVWT